MARPHGAEHPRIQRRHEADKRAPLRGNDVAVKTREPRFKLPLYENHLCGRVGGDQVLGEGDGGRVRAYGTVATKELVPVAEGEGGATVEVFGVEGCVPEIAVLGVGEEDGGVVAGVAEDVEGGLHCC